MPESPDLTRLRAEYAQRRLRLSGSDRYSYFDLAHLFALQSRERQVLQALKHHGCTRLSELHALEVGCGGGGVLRQLNQWGVTGSRLHGVDLLFDRLLEAQLSLPAAGLAHADGQALPYPKAAFDLVLQFTALSSILDAQVKQRIAAEMLRVLKPTGLILWYDFWLNPTNRQTRGIRPAEVRALFPGCTLEFHRITLAPPIARRLVRLSWSLAGILESLRIFNSHYLVVIQKAHPAGG